MLLDNMYWFQPAYLCWLSKRFRRIPQRYLSGMVKRLNGERFLSENIKR